MLLEAAGVGAVLFGAPADEAVSALSQHLGPPDDDTGLVDPAQMQVLGGCPEGRQRAVRWGQLTIGILDGATEYSPAAEPHLFTYSFGGRPGEAEPRLSTAAGISVGDTAEQVEQAYGPRAQFFPGDETVTPYYRVDLGAPFPLVVEIIDGHVGRVDGGQACGE